MFLFFIVILAYGGMDRIFRMSDILHDCIIPFFEGESVTETLRNLPPSVTMEMHMLQRFIRKIRDERLSSVLKSMKRYSPHKISNLYAHYEIEFIGPSLREINRFKINMQKIVNGRKEDLNVILIK